MTDFDPIVAAAEGRAGGAEALQARLPKPKTETELKARGDDRYLSLMSLRIFRAGLRHGMVDARWPAFEEVFMGFDPRRVRAMSDEAVEALMGDRRLIRHWAKMKAVRNNAASIRVLAEEGPGMGAYLADWPPDDVVGLWHDLGKRFSQMGGNSAAIFLRMAGKDTFLLTGDVVRALGHWGAFEGEPKGKRAQADVQAVFNAWGQATGRPLCQLSMILALSVA